MSERTMGMAAYGACLYQQIASPQAASGIPSLQRYDDETRRPWSWLASRREPACVSARTREPIAHGACLRKQADP